MPKVITESIPTKVNEQPAQLLDTLAQLRKVNDSKAFSGNQINLQKRSRRKAITDAITFRLVDIDSPLNKSYWQTYHCTRTILQDGNQIKSRYCNQRWCLVCNSIRTGKMINGYLPAIEDMVNPYFVTLTVKNVKAYDLKQTIESMQRDFRRSMDKLKKQGIVLKGIRKVEVTFNESRQDYHPHFHCIIDGCKESFALVSDWIKRHPEQATYKGQDIRFADRNTTTELFKYFTKLLTKNGQFLAPEMDIAFRAMKSKRVFQPFGGIKKQSEEVELNDTTLVDWKPEAVEIWQRQEAGKFTDWFNANGEALSEIELPERTIALIKKIMA
jgi:hypothetical protein